MKKSSPTQEQLEIINYDGDLLVIAVPGSGKTKTIIDKVEKLAKTITDKNIIVITYTYRAADEVADRISNRNIGNDNVWTGTIHKFCLEYIVNPNLSLIPDLCCGYDIADEDDIKKIERQCAENMGIHLGNDSVNLSLDINGEMLETNPSKKRIAVSIYEYLKENKMISFDQILYYAYYVLTSHTYVAKNIAFGAHWIIVDEYQDTKELQYQIVSKIATKTKTVKLMFVGDPNQAIYTNLGGVVKDVFELNTLMGRNFQTKGLTGCFRSAQKIINFYSLFACVPEKIDSMTSKYEDSFVKYFSDTSVNAEEFGLFAKKYIDEFHNEGTDYADICVAMPWGFHLMHLSSWFLRNAPHIPIDSPTVTPLKKMDDGIWNNLVRTMFVTFNYNNVFYYERMMKSMLKDIERRFNISCRDKADDLLDYYTSCQFDDNAVATEIIKDESRKILHEIIGLSADIYEPSINFLISATKDKIRRYTAQLSDTVECFKQCYKSKNGVVFSTFHGCKGEEYRGVIVGGLNEGYVPHSSRLQFREDSKRLLYVVMSRSKERLVISSSTPDFTGRYAVNKELSNCQFIFDNE